MGTNLLLRSQFAKRLSITHPVILAPMAHSCTPELVASVSNAGGLGSFGFGTAPGVQVRDIIKQIYSLTAKPFNANLFIPPPCDVELDAKAADALNKINAIWNEHRKQLGLPAQPNAALPDIKAINKVFQEQAQVLLDEKVPVFSWTFGMPDAQLIQAFKAQGTMLMGTATNVHEAQRLEDAGVDVVVAQGREAGGHRGTWYDSGPYRDSLIDTARLVAQVTAAVRVPVVATGGIMTGEHIARLLHSGAAGVQLGTAFLVAEECCAPKCHKQALLTCRNLGTTVTQAVTGKPARSLHWSSGPVKEAEVQQQRLPNHWFLVQARDVAAAAGQQGLTHLCVAWAGANYALCHQEMPAAQLYAELVKDAEIAAEKLKPAPSA